MNRVDDMSAAIDRTYAKVPEPLSTYTDKLEKKTAEVFKAYAAEALQEPAALKGEREVKLLSKNPWKNVRLTEAEEKMVANGLFPDEERPGELGEIFYLKAAVQLVKEMGVPKEQRDDTIKEFIKFTCKEVSKAMRDKTGLPKSEGLAIWLYTGNFYRLINWSLDGDETNRIRFQKEFNLYESEMPVVREVVVPILTKTLASALNHLPDFGKDQIYRGDAIPKEELKEWKEGRVILAEKFLSCSPHAETCRGFAIQNCGEYTEETGKKHIPVVFVFDCESGKNISEYSQNPLEEEVLYLPGQKFEVLEVTKREGTRFIYLQEIED